MPFTTFVAGTESQTFGATGTGTVLLNLLPHDLLIVTIAHIGNGVSLNSITNSTGTLTHLTSGATGGQFNDHDVYIETWYLDNAFGFLGTDDVLTFNFSGSPNLTQIIYRVVSANAGDVSWHLDIAVGNSGSETPTDTNNSDPSVESNEFFHAALQVYHQDDLSGAWGGGFTNGAQQSDPIDSENVVLNDGYRAVNSIGTYNATKVIDNNAFGPEWGTTLVSFYYKPRPVCHSPYRTIIVQDAAFPGNTFATVNVPRGIVRAVAYAYGRGGDGAIGEGGGCGGFAIAEMTLDPIFPGTIPVNISGSVDAGDAFASAGGTPNGGTGNGDYVINGGDGSPPVFIDFANFNGGEGCGGAAGGVWDGDTNGENGQGIGAGGGGSGGNIEVAGDPGIGGPGLGIVTLCAGLGWRQRIHRRHNTGQTNGSISHNTPLNQYTTTTGIGMRRKPILAAGLAGPYPPIPSPSPSPQPCAASENFDLVFDSNRIYNQETFVYGNSFTWIAPYGVYEVILQIQGNGTGGAQGGDDFGGCGGNGGECNYYVVSVIPGQSYPIVIDGTGIDWNSGEIFIAGNTSPQPGPTCDLGPMGEDGSPPECPGSGGSGGAGGVGGADGEDGVLGGGGGGGGAGLNTGGFGGEGWVRVFYVKQFGVNNLINQSLYPSTHQTHQTGQTNFSIPHCVPLNQQTTTKGIGMRRKWIAAASLAPEPPPPVPCDRNFGERGNFHQTHETGQTNTSIGHNCGLNDWTTTKGIGMRRKWIVAAGLPVIIPPVAFCNNFVSETFNETVTEWTAPPGVYVITVECQGAGGNGDSGATSIVEGWPGGGGGGSGGYAKSTVAVTPGVTYNISIGGTGSEGDTNFGSGMVVGNGGFGTIGGGGFGQIVFSGSNGFPGVGWVPPFTFSTGGNGADSPTGGVGGNGGQGDNSVGAGGGNGGLGAGGGGGGGGADVGGAGGLGGAGWMTLTLPSGFGINHTFHQSHSTGQTNIAISHNCALNEWTTTKGIGMRRKWFIPAEVPPPPTPTPFTAPYYTKYTYYAAALIAGTEVPAIPPAPPFCGRQVQASFTETTNWVVPAGVTEIYVECISGGGGGGDGGAGNNGGGGGGASAYAASLLTVVPATTYPIQIGTGGSGDGVDGTTTDFNSGQVVADFGVGATGSVAGTGGLAANSVGDTTFDGIDGSNGTTGSVPPVGGEMGGSAPGGGTGGAGGAPNTAGSPGNYPGGGAGGGGSTFGVGGGAAGADGLIKITWPSTYGLRGDIHQTHSTGQTNYSIMHCTPLNQYTTTKGIGMRRKYILDVNPSDLRITQEYAEVFNVDPPNPLEQITQFYFEIMDQPPPQAGWTSEIYRNLTFIAAALAEPEPPPPPPEPFTAQEFLMWVYIGAALAATLEPEPTPPSPPCNCTCVTTCNVCARSGACPPPTVTYGSWSGTSP